MKLFGFLKHWFQKTDENPVVAEHSDQSPQPVVPQPVVRIVSTPSVAKSAQPPSSPTRHNGPADAIELPLSAVVNRLPADLQGRAKQTPGVEVFAAVPLSAILPQLARGSVKISFGELRALFPVGTFYSQTDRDQTVVELPLSEILARLDPRLLPRRAAPKTVEVPAEITGPFGANGDGLFFSVATAKPESVPATPVVRKVNGPPQFPPTPVRAAITSVPSVPQPTHTPPSPSLIPASPALRNFGVPAATNVPPQPIMPAPVAPVSNGNGNGNGNGDSLLVTLAELAEAWPGEVKAEVVQLNLLRAQVLLPMRYVQDALKSGKVAFSWKQLRAWVKSPTGVPAVSVNDSVMLELPLKVIAPLFMAKQQAAQPKKKTVVDNSIPNLFFGPGAQPPPIAKADDENFMPATPKPADTNYYVWKDNGNIDDTKVVYKSPDNPGTSFLNRYATPNEIVANAVSLDNVTGALIALPDGLLVASRLPEDVNGDTLAAFLPQIFGRVSQCTKELRMGELNNLNFTVGNVPWKIFRVGAIYFAAYGKAGHPLPTSQLAGLAADLDRKPR